MNTSAETDKIDAILAKAQAEIENPTKDAVNPHFRSKYATLDAGLNIVRSVLSKHGISITQPTRVEDGVLMLDTRLAYQGQWIASEYPVCPFPVKQQEMGSALTYSRRYSLFSLVGIAGEEDDDGNAANATPTLAPKRSAKPVPVKETFPVDASKQATDVILQSLTMASTAEELRKFAVDNQEVLSKLVDDDRAKVRDAYRLHENKLKGTANAA